MKTLTRAEALAGGMLNYYERGGAHYTPAEGWEFERGDMQYATSTFDWVLVGKDADGNKIRVLITAPAPQPVAQPARLVELDDVREDFARWFAKSGAVQYPILAKMFAINRYVRDFGRSTNSPLHNDVRASFGVSLTSGATYEESLTTGERQGIKKFYALEEKFARVRTYLGRREMRAEKAAAKHAAAEEAAKQAAWNVEKAALEAAFKAGAKAVWDFEE